MTGFNSADHGDVSILFESDPAAVFPPARVADLLTSVRASLLGGRATLPYYRSATLRTTEKSPGDPVTEADHAANRAVLSVLERECPRDPILSEESEPPKAIRYLSKCLN